MLSKYLANPPDTPPCHPASHSVVHCTHPVLAKLYINAALLCANSTLTVAAGRRAEAACPLLLLICICTCNMYSVCPNPPPLHFGLSVTCNSIFVPPTEFFAAHRTTSYTSLCTYNVLPFLTPRSIFFLQCRTEKSKFMSPLQPEGIVGSSPPSQSQSQSRTIK